MGLRSYLRSASLIGTLTSDRNQGTSCCKPHRFKQEDSYPPSSMCPGDIPIGKCTHSRFRAIDRHLLRCGSVRSTGVGDLRGWIGHSPCHPILETFFEHRCYAVIGLV